MAAKKKNAKSKSKDSKPENVEINPVPFIPHITTGRPSEYDPKFCDLLLKHMSRGLSFEAFAGAIGISTQTLYRWQATYKELKEAHRIGKAKRRHYDEQMLDYFVQNNSIQALLFKFKALHGITDDVVGKKKLKLLALDKMTPEQVKELAVKYLLEDKKAE